MRKWAATGKTWVNYVQTTPWQFLAQALSRVSLVRDTEPSARWETINNLLQSCLHRYYDMVGPVDHTNI